jgi:hypothetical protein
MDFAIDKFSKERFGLVTGSTCTVLFPLKGDAEVGKRTYAKKLANEMFFQTYDERSTWETDHGKMAEALAFEYYNENIDNTIVEGSWFREGDCGGTVDAMLSSKVVDFKCPTSLQKWLDYIHEPLPKQQKDQLQMYMWLAKKEEAEIAAFLTETQFMSDHGLVYPVPPDKRMIKVEVKRDPTWLERLNDEKALPWVIQKRNEFLEVLKAQFANKPVLV